VRRWWRRGDVVQTTSASEVGPDETRLVISPSNRGLVALSGREVARVTKLWTQTVAAPILSSALFIIVFGLSLGERIREIGGVPYDQFIVLGPDRPQQVVDQIERETGILAAIVDVNDLRAVKVLAGSPAIPAGLLEQALLSNPAGNADEQTPIVLIRPSH